MIRLRRLWSVRNSLLNLLDFGQEGKYKYFSYVSLLLDLRMSSPQNL